MRRFVLLSLVVGCVGSLEPIPPENSPDAATTGAGGSGGSTGTGGSNGGSPDAGMTGSGGAGGSGGSGGSTCIAAVASAGDGHHNAGTNCMLCHNGSTATKWTVAGTLYDGAGAPVVGATIEVVQGNGQKIQIATCNNGNFYTSQAVTFPVTVRASQCPSDSPMVSAVQTGQGGCNSCHSSAMKMHLP